MGSSHAINIKFAIVGEGIVAEVKGPRVPCIGETVTLDLVKQHEPVGMTDPAEIAKMLTEIFEVVAVQNMYSARYIPMARENGYEYSAYVQLQRPKPKGYEMRSGS